MSKKSAETIHTVSIISDGPYSSIGHWQRLDELIENIRQHNEAAERNPETKVINFDVNCDEIVIRLNNHANIKIACKGDANRGPLPHLAILISTNASTLTMEIVEKSKDFISGNETGRVQTDFMAFIVTAINEYGNVMADKAPSVLADKASLGTAATLFASAATDDRDPPTDTSRLSL